MKKLLILIIGLLIAYPLFYFVAHNNGLLYKIPYGLVAFGTYFIFLSGLTSRFKDKSWYKTLSQFTLIVTIILSIVTYETFDKLTFGSREEQTDLLAKTKSKAIGKKGTHKKWNRNIIIVIQIYHRYPPPLYHLPL